MAKYFLALRLPSPLEKQCEFWRRKFHAPRTIAHITFIPPFEWELTTENLLKLLGRHTKEMKPFLVSGQGLGSFGKRVLFVNVTLGMDFETMQHKMAEGLDRAGISSERRPYRPHITLATRLTPAIFDQFRAQAAEFVPSYAFQCNNISLFKFSQSGQWEEIAKLPL